MIPQAIANTGPYADLWSHLKSMSHSVGRALNAKSAKDLTELDRERLISLSNFLGNEFSPKTDDSAVSFAAFTSHRYTESTYTLGIDLRQLLRSVPAFEQWNALHKLGVDKKLQKLRSSLQEYDSNLSSKLLTVPPRDELLILQAILSELLVHAESALQA